MGFPAANMARINSCLKHIFTTLNIFFLIVGGVAVIFALWVQFVNIQLENRSTQMFILYSVGCITMMISILGACGAHTESKVALIVFLVCMICGFLLMLSTGISAAVTRPQLKDITEKEFHKSVPLNKSTQAARNQIADVQRNTCFPIIMKYTQFMNNIELGVSFTLAVLALLGMILSSIMIHQVSSPRRPIVLPSMMPPKYEELFSLPAY